MNKRFNQGEQQLSRQRIMRVNIRRQMAHPMSEFLDYPHRNWYCGLAVSWFWITAESMVLAQCLLSRDALQHHQPTEKGLLKASYNIQRDWRSMERIDKILKAGSKSKGQGDRAYQQLRTSDGVPHVSFAYTDHQNDMRLVYGLKRISTW